MLFCGRAAEAQIDTSFWFAAPEVSEHTTRFDVPLFLNITAVEKSATVTVSIPANTSVSPITRTVAANASIQIDISAWKDQLENTPYNQVLNKGLYISATANIQVYYDVASTYCNCNPEIFTLKGNNALGLSFYIPSQTTINNASFYQPTPKFSFDIVATTDNTKITITPTQALVGHAANTAFSVTLNRGQTFSSAASSLSGSGHPAGTYVKSTQPIAITIKDDLLEGLQFAGGCADLTGDQIVPASITGQNYIVVKGRLGTGANDKDLACITATEDNTKVYAAGNYIFSLNAGETKTFEVRTPNVYIETTKPVYVLQVSGIGCELGSALLPPILCTGSRLVGLRRSASTSFKLYLNIMCPKGAESSFIVNGSAGMIKASDFVPVPANANWVTASILIDSNKIHTNQSMLIANSAGAFHLGIFEGDVGGGTGYGYISNYNKSLLPQKTNVQCKDSIFLVCRQMGDSVKWSDGSKGQKMKVITTGAYWVDYYTSCETVRDSFIVLRGRKNLPAKSFILCKDSLVLETILKGDSIVWSNGSKGSNSAIYKAGTYWADVYTKCQILRDSFKVTGFVPLKSQTVQLICHDTLKLALLRSSDSVKWWNGRTSDTVKIKESGLYWVDNYNSCGVVRDTFVVVPSNQIKYKSRPFCENDLLKPMTMRLKSKYVWHTGDTTASIRDKKHLPYYLLNMTNSCGLERDSFYRIKMKLSNDTAICGAFNLDLDAGFDRAVWNRQYTGRYYTVSTAGRYIAIYKDSFCEGTSDTINISYLGKKAYVFVPNAFSPNNDQINDDFPSAFDGVSDFHVSIYSRWGEMIFEGQNIHWSGAYKDAIVEPGVYLYIVEYRDCRGVWNWLKGTVTVIY